MIKYCTFKKSIFNFSKLNFNLKFKKIFSQKQVTFLKKITGGLKLLLQYTFAHGTRRKFSKEWQTGTALLPKKHIFFCIFKFLVSCIIAQKVKKKNYGHIILPIISSYPKIQGRNAPSCPPLSHRRLCQSTLLWWKIFPKCRAVKITLNICSVVCCKHFLPIQFSFLQCLIVFIKPKPFRIKCNLIVWVRFHFQFNPFACTCNTRVNENAQNTAGLIAYAIPSKFKIQKKKKSKIIIIIKNNFRAAGNDQGEKNIIKPTTII